jgi:small subunit ribosomal protein S21
MVAITVRNNNVDQAMRILKKKLQKEGVLREIKSRQYFEKPSAKRARKKAEGIKRYKRAEKKRLERFN